MNYNNEVHQNIRVVEEYKSEYKGTNNVTWKLDSDNDLKETGDNAKEMHEDESEETSCMTKQSPKCQVSCSLQFRVHSVYMVIILFTELH